ncbi:hypothetical protein, partial [Acinetobacter baumannii]|uniref:hypothetical protein n=1 Tax=Acinetobacter baumannii TaxID=470 RepID=UPI0033966369
SLTFSLLPGTFTTFDIHPEISIKSKHAYPEDSQIISTNANYQRYTKPLLTTMQTQIKGK